MVHTIVAFHAHPDDEVLLTGGTLARAAAEGHRVVLVVATAGGAGLASKAATEHVALAERRLEELARSAAALGCHEHHVLTYDDSGMDGRAGRDDRAFSRVGVESTAQDLAALLVAVHADVLTIYDPAGGYGHPDHVQVHRVGRRAAELAGTPVVLEATVDRRLLLRVLRLLRLVRLAPSGWQPSAFATAFAEPTRLTHRVAVGRYASSKRAAMAAHSSQTTSDDGVRSLALFLRFPQPLFRVVFGHEWFVETGRPPPASLCDDVFDSLHDRS